MSYECSSKQMCWFQSWIIKLTCSGSNLGKMGAIFVSQIVDNIVCHVHINYMYLWVDDSAHQVLRLELSASYVQMYLYIFLHPFCALFTSIGQYWAPNQLHVYLSGKTRCWPCTKIWLVVQPTLPSGVMLPRANPTLHYHSPLLPTCFDFSHIWGWNFY